MIFQIDRSQGKRCRFQAVLRDCPASSAPSRATGDSLTPEWGFGMAQPSFGCVARESRAHSMAFIVRILPVFTGWQLAVRHFKSLPLGFLREITPFAIRPRQVHLATIHPLD